MLLTHFCSDVLLAFCVQRICAILLLVVTFLRDCHLLICSDLLIRSDLVCSHDLPLGVLFLLVQCFLASSTARFFPQRKLTLSRDLLVLR